MRMPIVEYPQIVAENLSYFASVFETGEQRKHFCEYVTGLIAGDKATIAAINALFVDKNDQSSLNKFMTQAKWDELELNQRRVAFELERMHRRPVSASAGRLILDDTLAHHTRCKMEGLAYLYDHSLGHNVWGHNVVTSYYVNRSDQFPVDFRLYHQFNLKGEKQVLDQAGQSLYSDPTLFDYHQYLATLTSYHYRQKLYRPKTALGAELIDQALDWGLPFELVLFDSWFLRRPLIEAITNCHKDWIGGCPKDRLVLYNNRWLQLQDYIQTIPTQAYQPYQIGDHLYWVFTKVLPMKNLNRQRVRIVAAYQGQLNLDRTPRFYATNRKDWEPKRILTSYLDRWPTETFYEDAKGNLGFEDYQLRKLTAIRRHWYLAFVAYSLLGDQSHPGRSRWSVRGQFHSTGQRCQAVVDELLGYLVRWIVQQSQAGLSSDHILRSLLA